jgi:hypothetical protein
MLLVLVLQSIPVGREGGREGGRQCVCKYTHTYSSLSSTIRQNSALMVQKKLECDGIDGIKLNLEPELKRIHTTKKMHTLLTSAFICGGTQQSVVLAPISLRKESVLNMNLNKTIFLHVYSLILFLAFISSKKS